MEGQVPPVQAITRRPIQRAADDQAAALRALLARVATMDATDDEQAWEIVKRGLQETRRAQGQRLLFPE